MQPHLAYLAARKDILILGGATLTDDGRSPTGSLFIVNLPGRGEAEAFSNGDPFTRAGVFADVKITRVRKSQWNPQAADSA